MADTAATGRGAGAGRSRAGWAWASIICGSILLAFGSWCIRSLNLGTVRIAEEEIRLVDALQVLPFQHGPAAGECFDAALGQRIRGVDGPGSAERFRRMHWWEAGTILGIALIGLGLAGLLPPRACENLGVLFGIPMAAGLAADLAENAVQATFFTLDLGGNVGDKMTAILAVVCWGKWAGLLISTASIAGCHAAILRRTKTVSWTNAQGVCIRTVVLAAFASPFALLVFPAFIGPWLVPMLVLVLILDVLCSIRYASNES